ncbi:hypothetical protein CPB84DRAFT_1780781 [Gymnopilus junonius]|uniref:Fungal-type protein kinase domain-containing protein n=1 Tax=Gymnopilus junonius TaxID=109634 RepID=A0A9P5NJM8_GYMJU|nr:hypothetical protein CPB84DRAFT_1780781 [Gymnopilus junonius]
MDEFLSYQPHCLGGRATAVVSATGYSENDENETQMVCKIYHPEVQRRHEGLTMEVTYRVAEEDRLKAEHDEVRGELEIPSMFNYLPKFYFYGDVEGTSTQRVRSMVRRRWKGHRTMRIIGMKRLTKITTLKGWEFVKAWLEGVLCHAFLWQNFIEHGDPSLNNLMYDEETGCGVLTDFDLSLLQWEPRVFGTDRTGTIPFMALDLLKEQYWDGRRERYYHHELESFIWILPYVFLQYQDGKRVKGVDVNAWITSNYTNCLKEKLFFYTHGAIEDAAKKVQANYKVCWKFADALCTTLRACHNRIQDRQATQRQVIEIEESDDNGVENDEAIVLPDARIARASRIERVEENEEQFEEDEKQSDESFLEDSNDLWKGFNEKLVLHLKRRRSPHFVPLLNSFTHFKPSFVLTDEKKKELYEKYSDILGRTRPKETS